MTRKVTTVLPSATFSKIVKLLVDKKISGIPVINKKKKLVGIISEKDLFYKLFPSQKTFYTDPEYYMNFDRIQEDAKGLKKFKAKDFMTKKVIFLNKDDHILKACSLFLTHNISRLPVVEKGKIVGIVTTNDIFRKFLSYLAGI